MFYALPLSVSCPVSFGIDLTGMYISIVYGLPLSVSFPVYKNANEEEHLPLASISQGCTYLFFYALPLSVSCPVYLNVNEQEFTPLVSISQGCTYISIFYVLPLSVTFPVYRNVNEEFIPLVSISQGCTYLFFMLCHFLSVAQFIEALTRRSYSFGIDLTGMYISIFYILPLLSVARFPLVSISQRCTYLFYGLPLSVSCPVYRNVNEEFIPLVSISQGCPNLLFMICHILSVAQFIETSTRILFLWYRSHRDVLIYCLCSATFCQFPSFL